VNWERSEVPFEKLRGYDFIRLCGEILVYSDFSIDKIAEVPVFFQPPKIPTTI